VSTRYNVNIQAILAFECVQVCVLQLVRCSVCGAQHMLALCSVAVGALQCLLRCVLQRVRCSVWCTVCVETSHRCSVCVAVLIFASFFILFANFNFTFCTQRVLTACSKHTTTM